MRRLCTVLACAALSASAATHASAQGIYVQGTASNLNDSGDTYYGGMFGFYHDAHSLAVLHLGYDFRGAILKQSGAHMDSGLAGVRVSLVPHVIPFRFYGEALGGIAFNGNENSSSTGFQYQLNAGAEYTLLPHVDWRVVEAQYNGYSSGGYGNPVGLSTGIVFRLP